MNRWPWAQHISYCVLQLLNRKTFEIGDLNQLCQDVKCNIYEHSKEGAKFCRDFQPKVSRSNGVADLKTKGCYLSEQSFEDRKENLIAQDDGKPLFYYIRSASLIRSLVEVQQ